VKTLFATHYHELTELAREKKRVKNYNIAVKEVKDEIIFLRKLVEGGTNRSYGIQVARLAGIPDRVIDRAKKILTKIENKTNGVTKSPSGIREEREIFGKKTLQMELFNPEQYLTEEIGKLDIANLTPVEAINILHRLQEKIRSN